MIDNNIRKISEKKLFKFQSSSKPKQLYKENCFLWLYLRNEYKVMNENVLYFYDATENSVSYIGQVITYDPFVCRPPERIHYITDVTLLLNEAIYSYKKSYVRFKTLIEAKQFVRRFLTDDLINDIIRFKRLNRLL